MSDCGLIVMNYDTFAILRNDSNDFHVNEVQIKTYGSAHFCNIYLAWFLN